MSCTEHKFYERYEDVVMTAKVMIDALDNGKLRNEEMCLHLIHEALHNVPSIFSGLVSEKTEGMPLAKMTKEHFFSRKKSARKIFEQIRSGKSMSRLTRLVMSRARVHRVTKQENLDLIPFQHNPEYTTWQSEYKAVGIKLVPYVRKGSYTYIVEGKTYDSVNELANAYGMSTAGVVNRCNSKSAKFTEWSRVANV